MPSGRILISIGSSGGKKWDLDRHSEAKKWQKNEKMRNFWKIRFFAFESFLKSRKSFKWLVEQDGIIPTRRVIRCQGNFEKPSRQQIGKAKDLKSKFDAGSSVQISILFHFRESLVSKNMPSGRILMSIGSSGGKNCYEDCRPKAKKMTKIWKNENFLKNQFFGSRIVL